MEAMAEALRAVTPEDVEGWFALCSCRVEAKDYEHRCETVLCRLLASVAIYSVSHEY